MWRIVRPSGTFPGSIRVLNRLSSSRAYPNCNLPPRTRLSVHFAAAAGNKDVVDILIRNKCNPSALDANGETPADHARKAGHTEIATELGLYNERAGIISRGESNEMETTSENNPTTTDICLQSAFKELSLKDKLGLNLFVDRSRAAPMAFVRKTTSPSMMTDGDVEDLENTAFSFISEEDRAKLREAMSLASEMDLKEMNLRAEDQDVRQYLRRSNYEVRFRGALAYLSFNVVQSVRNMHS